MTKATAGAAAAPSDAASKRPPWTVGVACAIAAAGAFALSGAVAGIDLDAHMARSALRAAIEGAGLVILILAAGLVLTRGRRSGLVGDVVLGAALTVLAASSAVFRLVPALVDPAARAPAVWGATAAQLLAALLIVSAAAPGTRTLARPQRVSVRMVPLAVAVVVGLAVLATVFGDMPRAFEVATTPTGRLERDEIRSEALAIGLQVVVTAVWAIAATMFATQARWRRDPLIFWVAVALTVATVSRLDVLIWPDLWTGDVLRIVWYGAVLWGCLLEIDRYQRRAAQNAVFEERRRMARDLHDGLAAELAYIALESRRLTEDGGERRRASDEVVAAAERALEESRLAISALTRPVDEPLATALHHTVASAAERLSVEVRFDLEPGVVATPDVREALLRVALEALRNAVRHGGARVVSLELRSRGDGLEMVVADDGAGFDLATAQRPGAVGVLGMIERVENLGGALRILSALGEGTRVEAVLP